MVDYQRMMPQKFDADIADFRKVLDVNKDHESAKDGMKRAQRIKKNAGKRNNY